MATKKEYTCVLVETDGEGITWITFNRPEKRNAMNPTLHVEMEEILFGLETDEETSDTRRARHGHGSSLRISGSEEHGAARRRSRTDAGTRYARVLGREKVPAGTGAVETTVERKMSDFEED